MGGRLAMGTWVKANDGVEVTYVVDVHDESVEFSFGRAGFELILTEDTLGECATLFPEALRRLKAALHHDKR